MKIRIHQAADLDALVAYLHERDCVTQPAGPNMIEASRLSSVRHDRARPELELYLNAWLVSHPDAKAEIVD